MRKWLPVSALLVTAIPLSSGSSSGQTNPCPYARHACTQYACTDVPDVVIAQGGCLDSDHLRTRERCSTSEWQDVGMLISMGGTWKKAPDRLLCTDGSARNVTTSQCGNLYLSEDPETGCNVLYGSCGGGPLVTRDGCP